MRAYELMVILNPEVEDRAVEPSLSKFLEIVTNAGGTIDNLVFFFKQKTAYEIQKKSEGIYAVVNFTATPETAAELDRVLNLNESVMRTKIIRPEDQKVNK
ncbi:30S ribosomal protein S6 [Rothia dentocariosa]|uniref:30S ribosomal protein S6 n=1 Tax=Rothia dentocariosa TaxID=2047 RepID=UPI00287FF8DC|nr:30S ribosomal protein S6 [Rothia dentocariosa]